VYGLGAGLAGVAGTLISLSYSLNPAMGQPFLIKAFVVCVLGGLGSVEGALVGGLAYGIVEAFASQFDRTIFGQHISGAGLQDAVALLVLLIVLILRPRGILGRATA
jgi:branched-chain amino acid transport system permease protein